MPHFDINYIIFNEGKKSHVISFPINIYYLFTIKLNTSIASEFLLCGCNTFTSINILRNCAFVIPCSNFVYSITLINLILSFYVMNCIRPLPSKNSCSRKIPGIPSFQTKL